MTDIWEIKSETTECDIAVGNRVEGLLECCIYKISNFIKVNYPLLIILDKMVMYFG